MRLLLIEDDILISNALSLMLKHNHYSVDTVYDGEKALDYLKSENYDAIILDLILPKIDGLTLLKQVRQNGNLVPIIILSGKSSTEDKVLGLDLGANDYLSKPFESKELLARIRAMTRNNKATPSSLLSFGNISLDRATFELKSPTGYFNLANKEFQMMEMLMINVKHPIPTEKFMEKIWGFDTESEINVVWVHISYLRKKLTSLGADIKIKALRNTGYCLQEKV